ncbi:MAG: hypothetical protein HYV09_22140 [Deltaproteobacteria bacterium]|nr:hypothetical protein [Deltaproteobacteria bacterium]
MATTAKAASRPAPSRDSTKKAGATTKTGGAAKRGAKDAGATKAPAARVVKAEPFEREVVERLREEVQASLRRKSPTERRLAGVSRALAVHSQLARGLLAEAGDTLAQKKGFDRELFIAAVRGLGELADRRAIPLVKAGAEHDESATAALCAASWLSDASLAPVLNKAATQRSAHIAFTAELARVIRGESPGAHLRGLAPKIKESHRISLCAEVLVPVARIPRVPPGVQYALEVLRDAERHLGRWLVMAEVAVHGGDLKPIQEAREKSNEGPGGARAAWAYVAWALDQSSPPPIARPTTELVARLSDRPSADRDTKFLFRLAHAGVKTTKQLLETFARELPKGEDDDAVRAASYLLKDHGREDLAAPIVEVAKNGKRDELRGLAVACLWDAGKRDLSRELAKELVETKAGLFSSAWAALVLLADAGRIPASQPIAHEPAVRWIQAGWLE